MFLEFSNFGYLCQFTTLNNGYFLSHDLKIIFVLRPAVILAPRPESDPRPCQDDGCGEMAMLRYLSTSPLNLVN